MRSKEEVEQIWVDRAFVHQSAGWNILVGRYSEIMKNLIKVMDTNFRQIPDKNKILNLEL